MTSHRFVRSVVIALALAAGLTACSPLSPASDAQNVSQPRSTFDGPVPDFSGPWAADFAEAYRSTTDELVHAILAKESISEQDYASLSGRFVKCMANKGFRVQIDGPAGEMTIFDTPTQDDTDRAFAASNECDSGWSVLCALRHSLLRNPEHLDESTIMVSCLAREKLVPSSYTAKDYARDDLAMKLPFSTTSMGYDRCLRNPLALGSTR